MYCNIINITVGICAIAVWEVIEGYNFSNGKPKEKIHSGSDVVCRVAHSKYFYQLYF